MDYGLVLDVLSWSPDGSRIVAASLLGVIEVMNPDGSGRFSLMDDEDLLLAWESAWSADSRRMSFVTTALSGDDFEMQVFLANADGSGLTTVATAEFLCCVAWSPDAERFSFVEADTVAELESDIFVSNADGSSVDNVTNDKANDWGESWSADGSRILFSSNREGNQDVFVMNPDGSNLVRLTDDPADDQSPAWQPAAEDR